MAAHTPPKVKFDWTRVEFHVPVRTVSALNVRECWRARAARVKRERAAVALCFPRGLPVPLPCAVELTRVAPARNQIRDSDNLPGALKAVRDEVARQLGVDDSDPRIRWAQPAQVVGPWGVQVIMTATLGVEAPPPRPVHRLVVRSGIRATPAFIPAPKEKP